MAAVRGRHVYTDGYAGLFVGNVKVTGALTKGGGGFRVDHPVDPENNYLSHSFVESPDMTNVYSGKPCALIPSNTFLAKIRYRRGYGFRSADTSAVRGRGRRDHVGRAAPVGEMLTRTGSFSAAACAVSPRWMTPTPAP